MLRLHLPLQRPTKSWQPSDVSSSDSSSLEGEEDEETKLAEEIKLLKRKLKKWSLEPQPPPRNPDFQSLKSLRSPSAPMEDIKGGVLFPVLETVDPQQQEQVIRHHESLSFKDIKQLKEAVIAYGPHASFTVTPFESFSDLHYTPSDWLQLCRAVLSGGDFLLWRAEFQEQCRLMVNRNTAAGFPACNIDTLTGAIQYAPLTAQIVYDPAVYAQIEVAATRAWKALPNLINTWISLKHTLSPSAYSPGSSYLYWRFLKWFCCSCFSSNDKKS